MRIRSLFASLCLLAAAGCSGGSGGSSLPGSSDSNQSGGGNPAISTPPINFTNTVIDNISSSDPNYNAQTLVFGKIPLTLVTTLTSKNYAGTFKLSPVSTSGCSNPANVFSISTTNSKAFSITAKAVGLCEIAVTDTAGSSAQLWISVSTVTGVGS